MYLTEKLVLLIGSQLDTSQFFQTILAVQADELNVDEVIHSVNAYVTSDVAAGDPDVNTTFAEMVGEEAVGGTVPTPDQSVVEDIGDAAGVTFADNHPIQMEAWLNRRDQRRWELDLDSAEDYGDRN